MSALPPVDATGARPLEAVEQQRDDAQAEVAALRAELAQVRETAVEGEPTWLEVLRAVRAHTRARADGRAGQEPLLAAWRAEVARLEGERDAAHGWARRWKRLARAHRRRAENYGTGLRAAATARAR